MSDVLATRQTGKLPLSIGTSLAIESFIGIHDELSHPTTPIYDYDSIWINLRTLCRNIIGAAGSENLDRITDMEMSEVLLEEMASIAETLRNYKPIEVVFYVTDMNFSLFPFSRKRTLSTEKKRRKEKLAVVAMGNARYEYKQNPRSDYRLEHFRLDIKPVTPGKTMIITHIAYDLTNYADFKSLTLLESHTGHIKERSEWYTKYHNGQELKRLPLNKKLMQIFGDKEVFHPLEIKVRNQILEVADKYNWTPLTTTDKINYGINTIKNEYLKRIFSNM